MDTLGFESLLVDLLFRRPKKDRPKLATASNLVRLASLTPRWGAKCILTTQRDLPVAFWCVSFMVATRRSAVRLQRAARCRELMAWLIPNLRLELAPQPVADLLVSIFQLRGFIVCSLVEENATKQSDGRHE